jgi:predicted 2-oxoglutarate/Fe(II)-dependent dioxygenase YbiX
MVHAAMPVTRRNRVAAVGSVQGVAGNEKPHAPVAELIQQVGTKEKDEKLGGNSELEEWPQP